MLLDLLHVLFSLIIMLLWTPHQRHQPHTPAASPVVETVGSPVLLSSPFPLSRQYWSHVAVNTSTSVTVTNHTCSITSLSWSARVSAWTSKGLSLSTLFSSSTSLVLLRQYSRSCLIFCNCSVANNLFKTLYNDVLTNLLLLFSHPMLWGCFDTLNWWFTFLLYLLNLLYNHEHNAAENVYLMLTNLLLQLHFQLLWFLHPHFGCQKIIMS